MEESDSAFELHTGTLDEDECRQLTLLCRAAEFIFRDGFKLPHTLCFPLKQATFKLSDDTIQEIYFVLSCNTACIEIVHDGEITAEHKLRITSSSISRLS